MSASNMSPSKIATRHEEEYPLTDTTTNTTPNHISSSVTSGFNVDYQWSKCKVRITDASNPDAEPLYIADYGWDNLTFRSASSDGEIIGTGHNNSVSINSEYSVNGHSSTIQAAKRLKTQYTHLSRALVNSPGDAPRAMDWKTNASLKHWDFVCLDSETQEPVARFHSNVWYVRKVGTIEFLGPKAQTEEAKRELMVVGLTIYNQMLIRMSNPLSLLGALKQPKPFEAHGGADVINGPQLEQDTESVERVQVEAGKAKIG